MRRFAIAGVVGLATVSALLIAFGSGAPARPPPPAPAAESPVPPPTAAAMDPSPTVAVPAPGQAIAQPMPEPSPEPAAEAAESPPPPDEPAAEPVPWDSVRPLPRGWPALSARIAQMQPTSLQCRDHFARGRFRERSRAGRGGDAQLAVLMLQLETLEGAVRIVDASVERKGESDDAVIACVQDALRGLTVPMSGTRPGSRQKLPYPLR